ncbi:hypothetical protein M9H77_22527 [Catharanthus roseus]|uniref:Uncharacterized protein n=1 Tax=Catharanthus roseus TaxID=4058 RepID=A0ACC0AQQ7_CATRO|nr:hypothetical protein M9H77_22527 [Catharanthus roseus]
MDFMGTYKSENNHPSSSNEVAKTMWRLLWQTEIPPKVKLLGWKICSSIVPTTRNLRQQQLFVEDVCPHCRNLTVVLQNYDALFSKYIYILGLWSLIARMLRSLATSKSPHLFEEIRRRM